MDMRAPIFFGNVEKGRIVLDNKERFIPYLKSFEGKRIELVLREKRTTRSGGQSRYYWGVVLAMLADHTGHSKEEMHDILKEIFKVESTAKLKTQEFEYYLSQIKIWAAEFYNLPIPDPQTIDY